MVALITTVSGAARPCSRAQIGLCPGQALGPVAAAHLAHHHQPGMDAHAHRQAHAMVSHQGRVQDTDGLDNSQAGVHGPRGIVFMRLRIAKIHQQSIAEILRNMPGKALDNCRADGLVGADDLVQIFRVELLGQARRVHQVAEQHCELAAFGRGYRRHGRGRYRLGT